MHLVVLAGILIVASFPPWNFRGLIFIALIPWLYRLRTTTTWRRAAIWGLFLSMAMSLLGFYWVAYVLHEFGGLPWAIAGLGLLIFSTFGQPQFTIFAPIYFVLSKKRAAARGSERCVWSLAIALLYAGIDWSIPKLFHDTLGHSQYSAPWLRQSADLFGAHGLTFLIFWINDSLLDLIFTLRQRKEPSFWPSIGLTGPSVLLSLLALGATATYGKTQEKAIQDLIAHAPQKTRAAVIQANIGDIDKLAAHRGLRAASEQVMDQYFSLSDRALNARPQPDFLVWPETAYPSTFRTPMTPDDLARDEQVENFVNARRFPLLFGGYDRNRSKDFNTFFLLTPHNRAKADDSDLQIYHKNILLMFGEYVPFTENNPLFQKYFPQVANFGRGPGPDILTVPTPGGQNVRLSPVICYEVLFPDYVLEAARRGSQFIMNITNDSWFGPYGEPELHLALSTFRSIEARIPQLRATNTGISALILPDGSISAQTQTFAQEILSVEMPLITPPWTLMKQLGDWFGYAALPCSMVLIGLMWRRRQLSKL
ncbi:MAG: apolipoprotein N-acyltransferase [Oligoflexia bacterium]|nr:apolipoprotein N-acyltransferase [Oligoflexia bacterium]